MLSGVYLGAVWRGTGDKTLGKSLGTFLLDFTVVVAKIHMSGTFVTVWKSRTFHDKTLVVTLLWHYVDIVGVTGSIPVTPTISPSRKIHKIKILHPPCSIDLCCLLSPDNIWLSAFCRDSVGMKRASPIINYPLLKFLVGACKKN